MDYWLTEHLRLNGVYWGLTALHLLGHPEGLPRDQTIKFVLSCQNVDGGFGAAPGHDSHLLYSVSAVQLLVTVDALDELNRPGFEGPEQVGHCELEARDYRLKETDGLDRPCELAARQWYLRRRCLGGD